MAQVQNGQFLSDRDFLDLAVLTRDQPRTNIPINTNSCTPWILNKGGVTHIKSGALEVDYDDRYIAAEQIKIAILKTGTPLITLKSTGIEDAFPRAQGHTIGRAVSMLMLLIDAMLNLNYDSNQIYTRIDYVQQKGPGLLTQKTDWRNVWIMIGAIIHRLELCAADIGRYTIDYSAWQKKMSHLGIPDTDHADRLDWPRLLWDDDAVNTLWPGLAAGAEDDPGTQHLRDTIMKFRS